MLGLHFAGAATDLCTGCFNLATKAMAIGVTFAGWPPSKQPDF
jgi:hypothetical protein